MELRWIWHLLNPMVHLRMNVCSFCGKEEEVQLKVGQALLSGATSKSMEMRGHQSKMTAKREKQAMMTHQQQVVHSQ